MIVLSRRITRLVLSIPVMVDEVPLGQDSPLGESQLKGLVIFSETGIHHADYDPLAVISQIVNCRNVYLLKLGI